MKMILSITLLFVFGVGVSHCHAQQKPNIVLIVADDLGWADVSFHGKDIKTPNLDRLVKEGVELKRFYVCPICSPTRAGVLTGRYPIRFGLMRAVIPPWRDGGLPEAETTLAEMLALAGYRHRGIFGKWHLGHSHAKYHPLNQGFTEFVGHYNGAIDYFTHEREGELDWHRGFASNYDKGYSTDLIADAAVNFINRHAKDGPFFCYIPFNAPHSPLQAKAEDLREYDSLGSVGPKFKKAKKTGVGYGKTGRGKSQRQTLAAMISSMDQGIGKVLDALDKNRIAENTIVWFFSDNGGIGVGSNAPLRGGKFTLFAGGIQVAAALRWPAQVPAGRTVEVPLAYIDVFPTLMRVAGVTKHKGKAFDGVDALDFLTLKKTQGKRDLYGYFGQQGEQAEKLTVIEPRWKLIVHGPKLTEAKLHPKKHEAFLFDVQADPLEKQNLADKHREIVDRMLVKLVAFRALQPENAVPPYGKRDPTFRAPKEWRIGGN